MSDAGSADLSYLESRSNTWFETIAGNQRTCSQAAATSSDTCAGAQAITFSSAGSRPASSAAARTWPTIHSTISGSASWMITPSAQRPAIASTFGP